MKYYHSSTIFLRFSFPLTQFRSLQGKNLFIPQHWEHLATEAKVANASLTLTWSTSFHPVGPSLSFTPSLLTFPSKGGNLPLPWRLCSNLSSISPRSFPLSLSPSSLSSPLLFRTHDLPTPSNVRGHGYTRLCFLGAVQPAWKGPEAEGEGEEPVVNQNRRSSESPSHLFESVQGPARGFVPAKCAHLDIFPASRRVNNHRGADRLDHRPSIRPRWRRGYAMRAERIGDEVSPISGIAKTGRRTLSRKHCDFSSWHCPEKPVSSRHEIPRCNNASTDYWIDGRVYATSSINFLWCFPRWNIYDFARDEYMHGFFIVG